MCQLSTVCCHLIVCQNSLLIYLQCLERTNGLQFHIRCWILIFKFGTECLNLGLYNMTLLLRLNSKLRGKLLTIWHFMGVLHSFSIKNIFYDKMDLRLFYFHVRTYQFYQFYINFLRLNNKESVILSTVDPVDAPVKQEEIKVVSVFTKLHCSLGSWRILNWLDGWGVEKGNFDRGCRNGFVNK